MTSSLVLPSASVTKPNVQKQPHASLHSSDAFSFSFSSCSKPQLRLSAMVVRSNKNHSTSVKAQLNEVRLWHWFSFKDLVSIFHSFRNFFLEPSIDFKVLDNGSSMAVATPAPKTEGSKVESRNLKVTDKPSQATLASEESVAEFMAQVSNLIKLVDSRDVVELHMKQSDCELVIRKKEALPQPPPSDNVVMMHSFPPTAVSALPPPPAPAPVPEPVSSSTPSPAPSLPAGKSGSSVPPLKCPMAGTFYRCPGPGEPPFVKVGDKVQKGQILCIIEAMKLMNEIEADRSGKIVEILVEDGKPVSVGLPLFAIDASQ